MLVSPGLPAFPKLEESLALCPHEIPLYPDIGVALALHLLVADGECGEAELLHVSDCRAEDDIPYLGPVDGRKAHRAWLGGRIYRASFELMRLQPPLSEPVWVFL